MVSPSAWTDRCLFLPCVFLFIPQRTRNVLDVDWFALKVEAGADSESNAMLSRSSTSASISRLSTRSTEPPGEPDASSVLEKIHHAGTAA